MDSISYFAPRGLKRIMMVKPGAPYLVTPGVSNWFEASLGMVPEFVKGRTEGSPVSVAEFWNFLRDHKGFYWVSESGETVVNSMSDLLGAMIARTVLSWAASQNLCRQVNGEDMWYSV